MADILVEMRRALEECPTSLGGIERVDLLSWDGLEEVLNGLVEKEEMEELCGRRKIMFRALERTGEGSKLGGGVPLPEYSEEAGLGIIWERGKVQW